MRRIPPTAWLVVLIASGPAARGAEVSGRVVMPEVCSPAVSPAVVTLEPESGAKAAPVAAGQAADVALVRQRGLQFVPRVQALALGRAVRFTNEDNETHNVHVMAPGNDFNQTMSPGQAREFVPVKPGVLKVVCDVHGHMRAFLVVAASPWVKVCSREGRFRLFDVPDGRYTLEVWHEMGDPLRAPVTVEEGRPVDLGTLSLTARAATAAAGASAPVRPWPAVIERIGLLLASSLDAASRPGEGRKARRLAEDAYWGEFEASDMEAAVRVHLGFARAGELEERFRAFARGVRDAAEGRSSVAKASDLSRALLLGLLRASEELTRKGVTDRAHVLGAAMDATEGRAGPRAAPSGLDPRAQLAAVRRGLQRVRALADRGEAEDAASEMSTVYWDDFEPLERSIAARRPQDVRPLEGLFTAIRGEIGAGRKGRDLAERLAGLGDAIERALRRSEAAAGTFAPAFAASLLTIVREGAEVILILTMLIALAAKAGQAGAMRAIGWGVGLAVVASLATALGLNWMVASAQGRTRELLEGLILLAAAGVLFSVSHWLIAQSASKRWLEFLKRRARRGVEMGGSGTLALTAFLAVYREGAETALMYQAMIGSQAQSRVGLLGLAAGLGVGLALLAGIVLVIRATSVRLPLRTFFQLTGFVLFALAVVFAGDGIFALQESGLLKVTPLTWLGRGIPLLGVHPNVQALSVQALLLAGAALAPVLMLLGDRAPGRTSAQEPRANVGV
ncbi:MAG TPA: FTR1 family protein [Isosphaeraceae bacterium]|nr:FTR1 family protein [Isosphaeraceae bacterium]